MGFGLVVFFVDDVLCVLCFLCVLGVVYDYVFVFVVEVVDVYVIL